jgi:hypothetical protein
MRAIHRLGTVAVVLLLPSAYCSLPSAYCIEPADQTPVEKAVDRALEFLQRNQDSDGGWSAGRDQKSPAITGLAVMAFLSAGHIPGEGKYGDTVQRGVEWVLQHQQSNGLLANVGHQEMYHHGICTLMLAEVAGMTEGKPAEVIRRRLELAVAVILKGQRTLGQDRGGWRYMVAGRDSDISVTGWQVMALRAAKNLGCDVPAERIDMAIDYIKRCQDGNTGGFRYMVNAHTTIPCTGTSILALEICGKQLHRAPELLKAGAFLLQHPPQMGQNHLFYSVYYGSQAMFQLGGQYWESYRTKLQELLLNNQNSNGSWLATDSDSREYGPKYCTAMGVLALTVEYRYLPIYQRGEETAEKSK